MAALVFTLPDIGVPAAVQRAIRSVVAERDLQRSWKQSLTATYFAKGAQTLFPEPWWEIREI